jgi:hypothetical protein
MESRGKPVESIAALVAKGLLGGAKKVANYFQKLQDKRYSTWYIRDIRDAPGGAGGETER